MTGLRRLDDAVLTDVDDFARHTGWLHVAVLGFATYGVALFVVLLLGGVLLRGSGTGRALAAAGWACVTVLLAVGLNQPLVGAFAEARPYATHPGLLVLT